MDRKSSYKQVKQKHNAEIANLNAFIEEERKIFEKHLQQLRVKHEEQLRQLHTELDDAQEVSSRNQL
jgi:hypothetical protein